MDILFCDICKRSIRPEEIRFAEKIDGRVCCPDCKRRIREQAERMELSLRLGRWIVFLVINLLWFLAIIVITEVSISSGEVLALSGLAFVIYASSLLWLYKSLQE